MKSVPGLVGKDGRCVLLSVYFPEFLEQERLGSRQSVGTIRERAGYGRPRDNRLKGKGQQSRYCLESRMHKNSPPRKGQCLLKVVAGEVVRRVTVRLLGSVIS